MKSRAWKLSLEGKSAGRLTAAAFLTFVLTAAINLFFDGRAMRLLACLPLLVFYLYFICKFQGRPGTVNRGRRGAPGGGAALFAILSLLLLFRDARIIHIVDVGRACLMGVVLFLLLGLFYWIFVPAKNRDWMSAAIVGVLVAVYCFSAVHGLNYALIGGGRERFPVQVADVRKYWSAKGGSSYYVTVLHETGTQEELTVSPGVYRWALKGNQVEICQWVSIFGIRCKILTSCADVDQ